MANISREPNSRQAGKPRKPQQSQRAGGVGGCANSGHGLTGGNPSRDGSAYTQVAEAYARWLPDGDTVVTGAVMTCQAANMHLDGVPVWLVIVGGSGSGKTERVIPLKGLPHTIFAGEVSGPAALLAMTPTVESTVNKMTGGLLPQVGESGTIVIQDLTAILTLSRDKRAQLISALRFVYDGYYPRDLGAAGAVKLEWEGRCGLIACVTGAIDRAYSVIADLGQRWMYARLPDKIPPLAYTLAALNNNASEDKMRAELRSAVNDLMTNPQEPYSLAPEHPIYMRIGNLATLVGLARSPVTRDSKGEIDEIPDYERGTRLGKQFMQMYRAAGVIGMPEGEILEILTRLGLDSIPRLRGMALRSLASEPTAWHRTGDVAATCDHPLRSVRRALQELQAHRLAESKSAGERQPGIWRLTGEARAYLSASGPWPELAQPPMSLRAEREPKTPERFKNWETYTEGSFND